MDQAKINKILKYVEKGLRFFGAGVILFEVGVMFYAGIMVYFNAPDFMVSVNGWQLLVGIGSIVLKSFICSYLVFGNWHLEYIKKTRVVDSSLVGDRSW